MGKFKNPWGEGGRFSPSHIKEGIARWFEDDFEFMQQQPTSDSVEGLATAAEKLANRAIIMDYYSSFEKGQSPFFFSPNPNLESATSRPNKFSTWGDWDKFSSNKKKTISLLSGFKVDATDVVRNNTDLKKLINGYLKWEKDLYSVFWGNEYSGTWTCNIFVGDSIYLWKKKSATAANKHYYAPSQIYNGQGPFKKMSDMNKVNRGVIVLFGSTHMEIITSRNFNEYLDDDFCSIGAGRGNRAQTGTEKCDTYFGETREVENSDNSYYFL